METRPVLSSVVAKLMGIDESPNQQPVRKRRRVLSENYFRRVASIGVRERCHPVRLVVDHHDYKDVSEVASPVKGDTDINLSAHKGIGNLGLSELKTELSGQEKIKVNIRKYECFGKGVPNGLHKLPKNGCFRYSGGTHSSAISVSPMSSLEGYQLVDEKSAGFPSPSNGKINLEESCLVRKAKDQLFGQCKMTEKFRECRSVVKGIARRDFLQMPDQKIAPKIAKSLDCKHGMHLRPKQKVVRHDLNNLDLSKFRKHQDRYDTLCHEWNSTPKRLANWLKSRSSEYKFTHEDGSRPMKLQTMNKNSQYMRRLESEAMFIGENDNVVHNDLKNEAMENDSNAKDHPVEKETSMKVDEDSTLPLHCFIASDCNASWEEVYQPSPVSVLDSLSGQENTPSPECFESINVDTCEYSDTYSEGSGMIVSSDDDTNEQSLSDYKENDAVGTFKVEESRDFSYLIDVLMEAGFYSRGAEMDCDTWCFEEFPMSLYVFECLEKKFGDQVSWNRSERRLLFDRINDGLIEILTPSMGEPIWKKPVSRRITTQRGQEMVEEDLWMLLVIQEKEGTEAQKNLEEKLRRSGICQLDLGDEIEFIGTEIERFLISELVDEFVSNLA